MSELLDLALHLADLADSITSDGFSSRDFDVSRKGDATEVTTIDRAAETALREVVTAQRPSDGFYGEEHGRVNPDSRLQWVVDPIDGTSNFVRGVPVWATLIALVDDDSPVIGVVSAPALGRRWWGEKGSGAFANGRQIRVSDVASLEDAHVSITHSRGWNDLGLGPRLVDLQSRAKRSRGFGDFWQHMLVAEGAIDVAIDAIGLQPYDNAALYPIVTEAGGTISDRFGASDWRSNSQITTNGMLHNVVMSLVREVQQ